MEDDDVTDDDVYDESILNILIRIIIVLSYFGAGLILPWLCDHCESSVPVIKTLPPVITSVREITLI